MGSSGFSPVQLWLFMSPDFFIFFYIVLDICEVFLDRLRVVSYGFGETP